MNRAGRVLKGFNKKLKGFKIKINGFNIILKTLPIPKNNFFKKVGLLSLGVRLTFFCGNFLVLDKSFSPPCI